MLPQEFIDYLVNEPETGMGYQQGVTIEMQDGTIHKDVLVLNCSVYDDPSIDCRKIKSISV
jgi:hypothetical protein